MKKEEFVDFLMWILKLGYILKISTVEDLVDEYLKSANSEPRNESQNIRQNEDDEKKCDYCTCKKGHNIGNMYICPVCHRHVR